MEEKESKKELKTKGELIAFAYDVGFAIIMPLVIFVIIGHVLDDQFNTKPLFLISGILLSLITTAIAIYKKTKKFL